MANDDEVSRLFKAGRALGDFGESLYAAVVMCGMARAAKANAEHAERTGDASGARFMRAAERHFADGAVAQCGAMLERVAVESSAVSPTAGALVEAARLVALDGYRRARDGDLDADGPRENVPAAGAAERAGGIVVNVAAGDADEQGLHDGEGSA